MFAAASPDVLELFHPLIAGWFRARFGAPTAPQIAGWPRIHACEHTLIAAPTGSGKTLAAFLACLDRLVRRGLADPSAPHADTCTPHAAHAARADRPDAFLPGLDQLAASLPDATQILYVSPLKALSNDVHKNLVQPLAEIAEHAARTGVRMPDIRVGVRTGDTPMAEREKMAKRPPHILVTTPESLYILLTTRRGRAALSTVDTVIVDEIHAIAGDKRGAHLALTLERLDRLVRQTTGRGPVRVGLSATQRPIERVARLLVGTHRAMPHIVDAGHRRDLDLAIEITDDEIGAIASNEQMARVYDRITELVHAHRTTLVFVNTRRLVERVAAALEKRLGEEQVVAHHGSMSRELRFGAEDKLKRGVVQCAVATTSLELGIDVGAVDLVVQLGSPRALATLLQRVGRSGHHLGGLPKGRLFALTRDQLVECAALVRGVRRGNLDELALRDAPLDILAQQMVAICAVEEMGEDELFELARGAASYAELDRVRYEQLLTMLSEGTSDRRGRAGAHLFRDRVGGRVKARRGAQLAAIMSGGAIPDNNNYAVVQWPEEIKVGEIDEDFAIESAAGDIFQLGNTSWRVRRVENSGRVIVEDAHGQPPTIPFWLGEAPARTRELSNEVSDLRAEIETRLEAGVAHDDVARWLADEVTMSLQAARQTIAYLAAGRAALGALPTRDLLIAERFFDEAGGMQLVLHSPLGGRLNRAWGLALRKRFCRSFDFELQAAATDDGIVISLGQPHSFPLESVFGFLPSAHAEPVLVQALLDAPMFEVRWRWNATRSLTIPRRRGGKKVAPYLVRMKAADLLSVVFPQAQACLENIPGDREIPDHPLVFETIRDCLVEAMDVAGLTELMARIERGDVKLLAKDTVEPSPLCHELVNANPYAFLDDAPLEERRTRAINLRRTSAAEMVEASALDPGAIAAAEEEVAPLVRDPDELHDALLALWMAPDARAKAWHPSVARWLDELAASGRATALTRSTGDVRDPDTSTPASSPPPGPIWVATERLGAARALFPDTIATPPIDTPAWADRPDAETAARRVIAAHLDHRGPTTAAALAAELGLAEGVVLAAMLALEGDGAILRGAFTPTAARAAQRTRGEGSTLREALAAHDDPAALRDVEWCNRRILARIHRLTLARLRKEIEPVPAAALMRFLLEWQRVRRGAQLYGAEGLERVLEQLQGFETAAGAWEREILPARLHGYDPTWLDQMCLGGHVAWCRLSARRTSSSGEPDDADRDGAGDARPPEVSRAPRVAPSRSAPLTLMLRRDVAWLRAPAALRDAQFTPSTASTAATTASGSTASIDPPSLADLSPSARAVAARLAAAGASFLSDLVAATALAPDQVEDALWELVAAGLAAADGFASLRVLVDRKRGETRSHFDPRRTIPPLASAIANANATPTTPAPRSWADAVKRARNRDHRRPGHALRTLPTAAGRWSLLGAPDAAAVDVEASARQLLHRYGVVFRDLVQRETTLPPWRELAVALRRLEARGEIRGGRFVAGFVGEQFALAEAVDGLRGARNPSPGAELVRVPACDPLNLVGVLSPGPRVPAIVGNAVLYKDGVAVASLEAGEVVVRERLEPGARVDDDLVYHAPPRRDEPAPQITLPL